MYSDTRVFFESAVPSITPFDEFASKHALTKKAAADHICYKCGSSESFESIRKLFEFDSEYVHQSIISGRRIAYIRFRSPLQTALGPIHYLELSDQKPDLSQEEGFDHIEVYPTMGTYEEMVASLSKTETVVHVERPHHTTDDIDIGNGFLFRCTQGPLIDKIKRDEIR